jgi:predicted homoserine dehydrogenase-like protein
VHGLNARLRALRKPIRVGIIGAGSMGWGLLHQCRQTPGIECVALADIELERAVAAVRAVGQEPEVVGSTPAVQDAITRGAVAVSPDGALVAGSEMIDVLVESSNSIGLAALETGKDLVLMNSEIDLIFGPHLMRLAHERGLAYTSCDGDQHGVLKRLLDELQLWGFELVMAGNIKGFLDRYANPTTIVPEADKRSLGYKMCTAYTDGTKLSIEMALLANAVGLSVAVPGMRGPRASHVLQALELFDLANLRRNGPVADYILGAEPGGGVFAVGYCDDPYQRDMMSYYKMGAGPFYVFYRPYHLCHVEAARCIAEAHLDKLPLLEPRCGFLTNVYAYAKCDLRGGEKLDGIGGYTCYGMIDNCAGAAQPGLPICLAEGVPLARDVARDQPILMSDVDHDEESFEFSLFRAAQRGELVPSS